MEKHTLRNGRRNCIHSSASATHVRQVVVRTAISERLACSIFGLLSFVPHCPKHRQSQDCWHSRCVMYSLGSQKRMGGQFKISLKPLALIIKPLSSFKQ